MIKTWLNKKFLEWEMAQGSRKTLTEFSEWLEISQPTLSNYMNGERTPTGKNVHRLADKLGPEIYDLLEIQNPDPDLAFIRSNWFQLPKKIQDLILKTIKDENRQSQTKTIKNTETPNES